MNTKVTLGAVVLLAALGTYVALYERTPKDPTAEASKSPDEVQVLKYQTSDLKGFTVATSDASMAAEKVKGDWTLGAQGKKLDGAQVESSLQSLADLKSRRLVSAEATDKDRQSFGLDKPVTTIGFSWQDAKDKPEALQVGRENLDKSGYYAQTKPGKGIYVIDRYSVDRLTELAKKPPLATPAPRSDAGAQAPGAAPAAPAPAAQPSAK